MRAQIVTQLLGATLPNVIQLAVVQQRGDDFAALRRQIIDLEQLVTQDRFRFQRGDQGAHQAVDQLAGGRELIDANTLLGLLIEHDVVHVVRVVPDAEFGAHAVVVDWRAEHFRLGRRER